MTTLREAVQEYLSMRRALGFKLQEIGKGLRDFVTFMEKHRASYITSTLALAWAQQPRNVHQHIGHNDSAMCGYLRVIAVRQIHAPRSHRRVCCHSSPRERDPICTRMRRSKAYCEPR